MDDGTKLRERLIKLGRIKPSKERELPLRIKLITKNHILRANPESYDRELTYGEAYRRFMLGI